MLKFADLIFWFKIRNLIRNYQSRIIKIFTIILTCKLPLNIYLVQWRRKQLEVLLAKFLRGPFISAMITKNMFAYKNSNALFPVGARSVPEAPRALLCHHRCSDQICIIVHCKFKTVIPILKNFNTSPKLIESKSVILWRNNMKHVIRYYQ